MISRKGIYKPRFKGYYLLSGVLQIIDGFLTILVTPFGYESSICLQFCEWNLKKDAAIARKNRILAREKMKQRKMLQRDARSSLEI